MHPNPDSLIDYPLSVFPCNTSSYQRSSSHSSAACVWMHHKYCSDAQLPQTLSGVPCTLPRYRRVDFAMSVSVWLSVCTHISGSTQSELAKFSVHIAFDCRTWPTEDKDKSDKLKFKSYVSESDHALNDNSSVHFRIHLLYVYRPAVKKHGSRLFVFKSPGLRRGTWTLSDWDHIPCSNRPQTRTTLWCWRPCS